jgi:hypothetical protein
MTPGPLRKKRDRREKASRRVRGRGGRRIEDARRHPLEGLTCSTCGTELLPVSNRADGRLGLECPTCDRIW